MDKLKYYLGKIKCMLGMHSWEASLFDYLEEFGSIPDYEIAKTSVCSRCNKKYNIDTVLEIKGFKILRQPALFASNGYITYLLLRDINDIYYLFSSGIVLFHGRLNILENNLSTILKYGLNPTSPEEEKRMVPAKHVNGIKSILQSTCLNGAKKLECVNISVDDYNKIKKLMKDSTYRIKDKHV